MLKHKPKVDPVILLFNQQEEFEMELRQHDPRSKANSWKVVVRMKVLTPEEIEEQFGLAEEFLVDEGFLPLDEHVSVTINGSANLESGSTTQVPDFITEDADCCSLDFSVSTMKYLETYNAEAYRGIDINDIWDRSDNFKYTKMLLPGEEESVTSVEPSPVSSSLQKIPSTSVSEVDPSLPRFTVNDWWNAEEKAREELRLKQEALREARTHREMKALGMVSTPVLRPRKLSKRNDAYETSESQESSIGRKLTFEEVSQTSPVIENEDANEKYRLPVHPRTRRSSSNSTKENKVETEHQEAEKIMLANSPEKFASTSDENDKRITSVPKERKPLKQKQKIAKKPSRKCVKRKSPAFVAKPFQAAKKRKVDNPPKRGRGRPRKFTLRRSGRLRLKL